MLVEVNVREKRKIDIDEYEAFRILCKSLAMDFVLDEDTKYFVRENLHGERCVYTLDNEKEMLYDDRGDLFVALRNVAVNMFPNVHFRGAEYIYKQQKTLKIVVKNPK